MSKKRAGAFAEKRENQILNNIAEFQKKITVPHQRIT